MSAKVDCPTAGLEYTRIIVLLYKILIRVSFPQTCKSMLHLCVVYLTALLVAQAVGLQRLRKPNARY